MTQADGSFRPRIEPQNRLSGIEYGSTSREFGVGAYPGSDISFPAAALGTFSPPKKSPLGSNWQEQCKR